jgi:alpha-beta hydrolase superfamily lysophospholipase
LFTLSALAEVPVKASTFIHISSDGKAIFVRKWLPPGSPKAILLVAHGMAEHSERYERFAAALTDSGWAVFAPDHRGHGATAAPRGQPAGELGWLAEKNGFARIRDDLHEIGKEALAGLGPLPVFLYGHSMGSVLAETYLTAYGKELSGCVLSGVVAPPSPPLLAGGLLIASLGSFFKGQKSPSKLLHSMSFSANNKDFEPARTEVDWLSRDAAEVDKYVADPLCGFVCSFGFYKDMLSALRSLYGPVSPFSGLPKSLPVYILAGAEDPLGGARGFVPLLAEKFKAAGLESVETRLYPGARHEILNETNRDEVVRDIKEWLDSSLSKVKA